MTKSSRVHDPAALSFRRSNRLKALLIALCVAALATGCASFGQRLEPPEVSLVNVTPLQTSGFEQQFEVVLRVVNPNEVPLAGDGVDVTLELNGQRLGRALSAESFEIPRLGNNTVKLIATTNFLDLFRQALALPGSDGGLDYAIKGRLKLKSGIGWLPFTKKGNLMPDGSNLR